MSRLKAKLIRRQKITTSKKLLRDVTIWKLPQSERFPEGIKYRLALIELTEEKVLLLYDNHWPKGHHIHIQEQEAPYLFTSVSKLLRDFEKRSQEIERELP